MEQMFPNLGAELLEAGATTIEWPADLRWLGRTGWSPRFDAGIQTYSCQRPLLEWTLQRRMAKSERVRFIEGTSVTSLIWNANHTHVIGVRTRPAGNNNTNASTTSKPQGDETELYGNLVVDASGKSTHTPQWLQETGYGEPEQSIVKAFVGYATRYYTLPKGAEPPDWKVLLVQSRPPEINRAAGLFQVENNQWVLTLVGMGNENHPPTDEAGFMEFMKTLPTQELYDFIQTLEPVSPIHGYRVPQNRLIHYERLRRWPEQFMVLGDAACIFNPVYGHGISVIAQSVVAMEQCLSSHFQRKASTDLVGLGRTFQRELAQVLSVPWQFTVGEDLRYPTTEGGNRDVPTQFMHWFLDGVMMHALQSPNAHRTLIRVMHLLDNPVTFLRPDIVVNAVAANMEHAFQ
jgi:2-polyprenyl-6-methoxyphenol hydroxylase-like FAD-dependent oxidoreductase